MAPSSVRAGSVRAHSTPKRSKASRSTRQRIDAEHAALDGALRALVQTKDVAKLEQRLIDLRRDLAAHFAGEESVEGLHQVVAEGASHRLPDLQRLYDEHRRMIEDLDKLLKTARGALEGPLSELAQGVSRLVEKLRRHEQDEETLFAEAFYVDLGGRS
jgi:hemerythrin